MQYVNYDWPTMSSGNNYSQKARKLFLFVLLLRSQINGTDHETHNPKWKPVIYVCYALAHYLFWMVVS